VSKTKTRWTREFKLRALSRLDETVSVAALAEELGVGRERLYEWRRKYRSGGAEALRELGRPLNSSRRFDEISAAPLSAAPLSAAPLSAAPLSAAPLSAAIVSASRIAELERKIGQQQLDLDFFRAALRHVRGQRLKKGEPGETPSTR
jgi:transposase